MAFKNVQSRETITQVTQDEEKQNKNTTQHNMCCTPIYANEERK